MTESEVYQKKLKPMLKKEGFYFQRIEHERIPDLYIYNKGRVLWGEIKCIRKDKPYFITPPWRPGQYGWAKQHESYGEGSVCLILYYHEEIFFLPPQLFYIKEELTCQKEIFFQKLRK